MAAASESRYRWKGTTLVFEANLNWMETVKGPDAVHGRLAAARVCLKWHRPMQGRQGLKQKIITMFCNYAHPGLDLQNTPGLHVQAACKGTCDSCHGVCQKTFHLVR